MTKKPEMSPQEKMARHMERNTLGRCPPWCYCVTGKWKLVKLDRYVYEYPKGSFVEKRYLDERYRVTQYSELRRFSLNPMCPLIGWLCPPGGIPKDLVRPSTSLYMTTIEGTRFNDVIHKLESEDE